MDLLNQGDDDAALTAGRGAPLWRLIEKKLAEQIASGTWAPGERMPPELILAEQFGANRHTVRRAIQALIQRGLLRVEHGRGTFIREGVIEYPITRRTRFDETMQRHKREPSGEVLMAAPVLPPVAVARQLRTHPRTPVEMVEVLNSADGIPVSLSTIYFSANRFSGAGQVYRRTKSMPETLKHFGVKNYSRAVSRITARIATAEDARLLQQQINRPILQSEAVDVDDGGMPVSVLITRFASDRVEIVFNTAEMKAEAKTA